MTLFNKIDKMSVSDKTKEIYKNHLKKLNDDKEPLKETYLKNTTKIKSKLDNLSIISQINFLSSIMTVLKKGSPEYLFYYNLKSDLLNNRIDDLSKNKKERKYLDDINIIKDDQMKLLYSILTELPRRVQDFHLMKFYDGEINPNFNYLATRNGKLIFIFNNYKTDGAYGTQEFEFPSKSLDLLEEYLKKPEVKNSNFMFGTFKDGTIIPYTDVNGLSQKFKRETGLTFNDMRHIYAQECCSGITDQIDEHLKKLAHSYNTNLYYQKT